MTFYSCITIRYIILEWVLAFFVREVCAAYRRLGGAHTHESVLLSLRAHTQDWKYCAKVSPICNCINHHHSTLSTIGTVILV